MSNVNADYRHVLDQLTESELLPILALPSKERAKKLDEMAEKELGAYYILEGQS